MSKNVISASLVAGLLALWLGSGLFTEAPESTDIVLAAMPESLRQRVIFTHMNHSNPLHDPTSEAFKTVSQLGYRVARVGDQFAL